MNTFSSVATGNCSTIIIHSIRPEKHIRTVHTSVKDHAPRFHLQLVLSIAITFHTRLCSHAKVTKHFHVLFSSKENEVTQLYSVLALHFRFEFQSANFHNTLRIPWRGQSRTQSIFNSTFQIPGTHRHYFPIYVSIPHKTCEATSSFYYLLLALLAVVTTLNRPTRLSVLQSDTLR